MTSAVITAGTSTTTGPQTATPQTPAAPESARQGRTSERVDFRSASARLRENAGINDTAAVAAVVSFAEVGAAARRLRASNTFSESSTLTQSRTQSGTQSCREPAPTDARADHPSFAPAVIAPVLVPVVEAPPVPSPAPGGRAVDPDVDLEADLDVEEPIVIDLPACEVIYLDPQIGRRKVAANADRDLRRASLARRASELLATIEDAKRTLALA